MYAILSSDTPCGFIVGVHIFLTRANLQTTTNFGLLNRTYPSDKNFDPKSEKTQWERFENYVAQLNKKAAKGESYKVLFSARHGEGYHNVEEAEVGSPLWDVSGIESS
jgi:hypothetical protein